jgi:ATP citrate (pro-S)-lyase
VEEKLAGKSAGESEDAQESDNESHKESHKESEQKLQELEKRLSHIENRSKKLFISNISGETEGEVEILGDPLLEFTGENSVGYVLAGMLLGHKPKNNLVPNILETSLKMLVDHGPYQSGIVNTMVTARAGRDLSSALASGILTIGDRFGGALNDAAGNWLRGVSEEISPREFVEDFAARREYILGIGHKKYHTDNPDPRVQKIKGFIDNLAEKKYLKFAEEVEAITTSKKSNLILNVDGALAAVLMDALAETEDYTETKLQQLVDIEFFNAILILSRSIGMTSHFLDQKRIDEGLFRLSPNEVG